MESTRVQVMDRALDLMEQLSTSEQGLSITELSRRTGLPKSTVHRILNTFASRHYVEKKSDTDFYVLGYKFVEIASIYLNKIVLKTEAVPIMHNVACMFNVTSYLGVLENNEVMYLERVEPLNSLRLYSQIGKREPLHCTALGKVLLSSLDKTEYAALVPSLSMHAFTPNTITDLRTLTIEVDQVRANGYALDRAEHEPGIYCFAVPIYDYTRKVMAAMSISGPELFEAYDISSILEKMQEASANLSQRMGFTVPK